MTPPAVSFRAHVLAGEARSGLAYVGRKIDQCAGAGRKLRNLTALGRRRVAARNRWLPEAQRPHDQRQPGNAEDDDRARVPHPPDLHGAESPIRDDIRSGQSPGQRHRRRSPAGSVVRRRRRRRSSPSRRDNFEGSDPSRGRGRGCASKPGPAPEPGTCAPGVATLHAPNGSCATADRAVKPQDVAAPADMQAGRCASRERQNVH